MDSIPLGQTKKRNTKQELFEAAVELFARDGFAAVSVRDITAAVGIKESSLYKHYQNKDALLEAILDYFAQEIGFSRPSPQETDALLEMLTPEEFFRHVVVVFGQRITPLLDRIFRILMMEQFRSPRAREFVREELIRGNEKFARMALQKMREKDLIGEMDIDAVAMEYGCTLFALSLEYNIAVFSEEDPRPAIHRMMRHVSLISALMGTKKNP